MIVINDDFHLMTDGKIYEGGIARNEAVITWIRENDKNYKELRLDKNRVQNAFTVINFLSKIKNAKILLFYPTVGVPLNKNGIVGKIVSSLFFSALKTAEKNNEILIDICDLKYEQSIDLQIDRERRKAMKNTETKLFNQNVYFNFASSSMQNYAIEKYMINPQKTGVLLNGGINESVEANLSVDSSKINLVYAGTLNKGRSIEKMIDSVNGINNIHLYLLGAGGEWIDTNSHVTYLGKMEEARAHAFVRKCDMGLIPYDESKLYYNLAYPTKLSFYLTAGIPFLSTDVSESNNVVKKYKVGYVQKLKDWKTFIGSISKEDIEAQKRNIAKIDSNFLWSSICSSNKLLNYFLN